MPIKHYVPPAPPPRYTPKIHSCLKGTGPQYIKQYLFLCTYILTTNNQELWIYPVRVDQFFVYAYIWKNERWTSGKMAINEIDSIY